jgi:DnaK suppressor protein
MKAETLQKYRELLLAQQQQIEQRIFRLETDLQAMESEREIERTDHIQEEAVNDTMIELDERSRRLSEEIQAALARLDDGIYGDCEVCGEPINPARLEVLPTARRCVACQAEAEQAAQPPPGAGAPDMRQGGS